MKMIYLYFQTLKVFFCLGWRSSREMIGKNERKAKIINGQRNKKVASACFSTKTEKYHIDNINE